MKTKYLIYSVLTALIFISCEKVIDLDLKDAKPQIVVEAQVNNGVGNNYVALSKSGSFYESNNFEMVKDAVVEVIDENGNSFILNEFKDGLYQNPILNGNELESYKLNISTRGQTITSSSQMPQLVKLDSLTFSITEGRDITIPGPGGGGGGGGKDSYKIYCHFEDPVNINNFYKFKITNQTQDYSTMFILNDDMFEGKPTRIPIRGVTASQGDTVYVELFSIDRANYEYYKLLEANDMGAFTTSIGNPVSNVEGTDVIGVFGANAIDIDTLIFK